MSVFSYELMLKINKCYLIKWQSGTHPSLYDFKIKRGFSFHVRLPLVAILAWLLWDQNMYYFGNS